MNRRNAIAASLIGLASMHAVSEAHDLEPDTVSSRSGGQEQQTFLLVHGAWHGGWCWKYLQRQLHENGHVTYAPTLTGLADKADLLDENVDLDTHIQDVVSFIEDNDLENFVLVGHSYGGMVITGVAQTMASKIKTLVYLDAIVPQDQDSLITSAMPKDPEMMAQVEKSVLAMSQDGISIPPPSAISFGIPAEEAETLKWVDDSLTPHPLKTWIQPLAVNPATTLSIKKVFVHCVKPELESNIGAVAQRVKADEHWTFLEMQTGHNAMITQPLELADLLEENV